MSTSTSQRSGGYEPATRATIDTDERQSGLLCVSGRARIVIPTADALQIIEYSVTTPLPLAREFVGGLGVFGGRMLVSIALDPYYVKASVHRRFTKGVLLERGSPRTVAWAIEVRELRTIVRVAAEDIAIAGSDAAPAFLHWRKTLDDQIIGWLDVPAMLAELSRLDARGATS
jgi:chemotaxis signal transduction protein